MKFALTVAGFDPTGGAGILRDVLTFKEFGFYGCAVITANTAQNTKGVKEVVFQDESLIAEQITLLEEEIEFSGVKLGLPHSSIRLNEFISRKIKSWKVPSVLDPVLSPTFGKRFVLNPEVLKPLIDASIAVTPNFREFRELSDILKDYEGYIIVKGIDEGTKVKDILIKKGAVLKEIIHKKDEKEVRGTGCAFSSSLLCFLMSGLSIEKSFERSVEYLKEVRKRSRKTSKWKQSIYFGDI